MAAIVRAMSVTAGQLRYEPSPISMSPPLPFLRSVHFRLFKGLA